MLNVVVLNGGRGAASLIPALLDRQGVHVTSVVNAYDDGKSTGEIRRFFGMLGPSDIRKVQELMLPQDDPQHDSYVQLFRFRYSESAHRASILAELTKFAEGGHGMLAGIAINSAAVCSALRQFIGAFTQGLSLIERVTGVQFSFADCSIMNCIYAGAFLVHNRNIEAATRAIDRLFRLRGAVLPTSIEDKTLVALRENGEMLYSEAEIVELRSNVRIERIYLLDRPLDRIRFDQLTIEDKRTYLEWHHSYAAISPGVELAISQADVILYAPGTQHSSLYPTYFSSGMARAIASNRRAFKAYVTNIGADYETPSYRASDYLRGAWRYLNLSDDRDYALDDLFHACLINTSRLKADETYVVFDREGYADMPVPLILDHFEDAFAPGRHNGQKVVQAVLNLQAEAALIWPAHAA